MSSEESDIEMKSALPKKSTKKTPKSPSNELLDNNTKKISTKMMIHNALTALKSRKGVSLYAIKKHITEQYNVNTDKINYIIKKNLKKGVEDGTIAQLKGVGASGSFKLIVNKEPKKKKIPKSKTKEKSESGKEKVETVKEAKKAGEATKKKAVKKSNTTDNKADKPQTKKASGGIVKSTKTQKKDKDDGVAEAKGKKTKVTIAKGMQTPTKKRAAMIKRKSIGSIIKPPKMKPKRQA